MSEEGDSVQFSRACSNDYGNETSSVQILLDTEAQRKSKRCKFVVGLSAAVVCFVFVLCIILLTTKPDNHSHVIHARHAINGSNSSSIQDKIQSTIAYGKGIRNK